ncbi:predicted protein [Lichtheimia corymbifera JMRC:FSU:9682]|uniref:Uncharacterized protein n=1 Tax=Lichtheimia corymbifera JMRC:FSU:9682 TaxID=1263082 RepID=A0A068SHC5_9FUNG|nr:predicted protein [Lichtheimia corymbifera JMRC:FSU:9682]
MVIDDDAIGAERSTSKSKSVSIDPVVYVQVLAFYVLLWSICHATHWGASFGNERWAYKTRIVKTWLAWHHGLVMEQTEHRWTRPFGAEDKTLKDPEVNEACMLIPFALHMGLDVLG